VRAGRPGGRDSARLALVAGLYLLDMPA